jgi:hypothetical protein
MRRFASRSFVFVSVGLLFCVALLMFAAGTASASIPDSNGVYHGCVKPGTISGSITVIDPYSRWNVQNRRADSYVECNRSAGSDRRDWACRPTGAARLNRFSRSDRTHGCYGTGWCAGTRRSCRTSGCKWAAGTSRICRSRGAGWTCRAGRARGSDWGGWSIGTRRSSRSGAEPALGRDAALVPRQPNPPNHCSRHRTWRRGV